jgi:DNA repair exonuclease SbcCD ATPase subunit
MAEDQTATAEQDPKTADETAGGSERPEDNLRAELDRRREKQERAERELEELRDRLLEFEERDKSEAERAKSRADRAESQLTQLQGKVTAMQKGAWVRSVAADLGFHDPEDAVAHLGEQLAQFEDERDAKRAVKTLAQSKKHLIRRDDDKQEQPRIGRVFTSQERQMQPAGNGNGNGQQPASYQQVAAQREAEFAQHLAGELNQFRSHWREMGGLA